MTTIDFVKLTKGEVRSLSGHDRGLAARGLFGLDGLDDSTEQVVVSAPSDLDALTPSFVQGLFAASVHHLGREQFYKHYHFEVSNHIRTDIDLGINRVLMRRDIAGTSGGNG